MIHLHLQQCQSTQSEVIDQLEQSSTAQILVSTENQLAGRGRGNKAWKFYPGSLAFSFTIRPPRAIQLAAMEMGTLFCQWAKEEIKLKWPNDLIWQGKKCGGILCQLIKDLIVVGVGVNISSDAFKGDENFNFKAGALSWGEKNLQKTRPANFYQFVLNNRLSKTNSIKMQFEKYCDHIGQSVSVEGQDKIKGIFTGLGENGEAIIEDGPQKYKILNGSLLYY